MKNPKNDKIMLVDKKRWTYIDHDE